MMLITDRVATAPGSDKITWTGKIAYPTNMSTEVDHAREIAERIARRVSSDNPVVPRAESKSALTSELAAVRAGLSELQRKIAQLEAKVVSESEEAQFGTTDTQLYSDAATAIRAFDQRTRPAPLTYSPWLSGVNASPAHASQEKFGVEEAVVSELVDHFEKEKTCSVEPGGKPCDHCDICSSRGF
jgi:hypothetical protein